MTLTKSVVIVWTMIKSDLPEPCTTTLQQKLQAMTAAEQTDGNGYWFSPQIAEYRFTDQQTADEFVSYLTNVFPYFSYIDSTAINNL
jgi:hypothetical protein